MKIKEQNEQCMVIDATPHNQRAGSIFLYLVCSGIVFAFWFLPVYGRLIAITIWVIGGLFILGLVIGTKIVIDKRTQSITIKKRGFLLVPRQRIIPFSGVLGVDIDYREEAVVGKHSMRYTEIYEVYLRIGNEKLIIYRNLAENYENIKYLAEEIGKLIGKPLPKRAEDLTREEIVARWRERAEQEAREKGRASE